MIFSIIYIRFIILRTPMKALSQYMRFWFIWFWCSFRLSFLLLLLLFYFLRAVKITQIDFLQFIFRGHLFQELIKFDEEQIFEFFIIQLYFRLFSSTILISFIFLNK
ncbi:unnamed protein product [Paramecium octaurelia]|uniref:Uncharacterized protein n=1 Tax=Paramecium octaurelia TaxID=43137 RepID=A0A8S1RZ87_PAROT|nr:unnamed protein product [Paramecium octaurelia]